MYTTDVPSLDNLVNLKILAFESYLDWIRLNRRKNFPLSVFFSAEKITLSDFALPEMTFEAITTEGPVPFLCFQLPPMSSPASERM